MAEKKENLLVTLVKKSVGLRGDTADCCGVPAAATGEATSTCCGEPTNAAAVACCGTETTMPVTTACCGDAPTASVRAGMSRGTCCG